MKLSLHFILAFGIVLAFASFALTEEVEEIKPETIVESRSGTTQDKVSPRVHALLAGHHHHLLHHHALAAHASHHPILTKKLLLLKFKGLGALAHHHHHHPHHLLHHALFHHHHHLLRSSPGAGGDSVVEVFPVSDPSGALAGVNTGISPSNYQIVSDTPTVQAYAVPSDYLQGVSDTPEDSDLENYEELSLDEVPETSPIRKQHLVSAEGVYDQAPIYLYALPQQVELGRSAATRGNKNRKKFKN